MEYTKELKDKYTIDELKHTIFRGDNRTILKTFPDKCINLIYIDPPFFSGRKYTTTAHNGEVVTYSDMYVDNDTYLETMYESIDELHRVLKDSGSIYLHCDWRASHKLKLLLDKVFNKDDGGFIKVTYDSKKVEDNSKKVEDNSKKVEDSFRNEIIWCYSGGGQSNKYFPQKHDSIFFYTKTDDYTFNWEDILIPSRSTASYYKDEAGKEYTKKNGQKYYRRSQDGKIPEDYWTDINMLHHISKERIKGFKTQKPMELLERIIKVSSNPGDIILDAFMGTGTTLETAYSLGRVPIGIDMGLIQINYALYRCKNAIYKGKSDDLKIIGMTRQDIEDYETLVKNVEETKLWEPERFERIMCMLEGAEWTGRIHASGMADGIKPNGDLVEVKRWKENNAGHNVLKTLVGALNERTPPHKTGVIIGYGFSKPMVAQVNEYRRRKQYFIELKTPANYVDLVKTINATNDEIEQEEKDKKAQFKLDSF